MDRRSDAVLVKDALAGDGSAFASLAERHAAALQRRIARRIGDAEDARDLVHDALLRALTRLGDLREPERFAAWLGRIADNEARGRLRQRALQLRIEALLSEERARTTGALDAQHNTAKTRVFVRRALAALSSVQREVVVHHYLKGYSYPETAALLGLQVHTVRSRLQKARLRLRREIERMTHGKERAQPEASRFSLETNDLDVLRQALRIADPEHARPILRGVCLDAGGRVVSTDGHRLFVGSAPGLAKLNAPVVLGPGIDPADLDAATGTLALDAAGAVLDLADGRRLAVPILEGPYAPYEAAIAADLPIRARLDADALRGALATLVEQLAPRHPLPRAGAERYLPCVVLRLAASGQTLSLTTTRDLGYALEDLSDVEVDGCDWKFTASVPAQIEADGAADVFSIGVDHRYLSDAVSALDGELELGVVDPRRPVQLRGSAHPDRLAVVMPMSLRG